MSHLNLQIPHPIIKPDGDDYEDCHFEMSISESSISNNIMHINFSYDLKSKTLNDLIDKNMAEFILLIKCTKTYRRTIHHTNKKDATLDLDVSDYASNVFLAPYVVTTKKIHMDISDEHNGELITMLPAGISLQSGSILAINKEYETHLENISSMGAAISLVSNQNLADNVYKIMPDNDKIEIHLSPSTYKMVKSIRNRNRSVLYPSLYLSAVETGIRELEEYENRSWTFPLKNALLKKGIDPNDEHLSENANDHAQLILGNPLGKLENLIGDDDEDD